MAAEMIEGLWNIPSTAISSYIWYFLHLQTGWFIRGKILSLFYQNSDNRLLTRGISNLQDGD